MSHVPRQAQRYLPLYRSEDPSGLSEHLRLACMGLNGVLDGQTNNAIGVTLTPNATETEVVSRFATANTCPTLTPMSASAAAAMAAGAVYATSAIGVVTIHHDSDPATDRKFGVVLFG